VRDCAKIDKRNGWRGPSTTCSPDRQLEWKHILIPDWRATVAARRPCDGGWWRMSPDPEADGPGSANPGCSRPKEIRLDPRSGAFKDSQPGDLATFRITHSTYTEKRQARAWIKSLRCRALIHAGKLTGEISGHVGDTTQDERVQPALLNSHASVGPPSNHRLRGPAWKKASSVEYGHRLSRSAIRMRSAGSGNRNIMTASLKGDHIGREPLIESRNVPTIRLASLIGIKDCNHDGRRFVPERADGSLLPLAFGYAEPPR